MNKTQARRVAIRNIVAGARSDMHNGAEYWKTDPDDPDHVWTDEEMAKIEEAANLIFDTMERHTKGKM